MTFEINPKIIQNDDVEITTDADGALSIAHKPSGQKFGLEPDGTLNTPAVDTEQAHIGSSNGTGDTIRVEPNVDALRHGYLVGHAPHYSIVVDPRDFASDAAAIQHVNDELLANLGSGIDYGYLYIPPRRPDGTVFTIDSTITIGSNSTYSTVILRGWGFGGSHGDALNITINDGSPVFHLVGSPNNNSTQLNATWFGGLVADGNGNDAEFFRVTDTTGFQMANIQAKGFASGTTTSSASGAYVFDGACYNSWVNRVDWVDAGVSAPNANVFAFENTTGNGPPGEMQLGPANSSYADPARPFNHYLHCPVHVSNLRLGGRMEGAGGTGIVYMTDGNLYVTDYAEFGRVENSTDCIHFSGFSLSVAPGLRMGTGDVRHCVYVDGTPRGVIYPPANADVTGDVVHIASEASDSHRLQVPYANSVNGSVTYPSERWANLVHPDGWQRWRTGTTTIAGNGTTELENYAGFDYDAMRVTNMSFATTPSGDPRYQVVRGYDSTSDRHWVGIEETAGVSFDLEWEVQIRPR